MNLTPKNLYVDRHDKGYSVFISMPDGTRNFLHNEPVDNILEAILIKNSLDGSTVVDHSNTEIIQDGTYYRIRIMLSDGEGKRQNFHSRHLNIVDAVSEYELLVRYED